MGSNSTSVTSEWERLRTKEYWISLLYDLFWNKIIEPWGPEWLFLFEIRGGGWDTNPKRETILRTCQTEFKFWVSRDSIARNDAESNEAYVKLRTPFLDSDSQLFLQRYEKAFDSQGPTMPSPEDLMQMHKMQRTRPAEGVQTCTYFKYFS